MKLNRTLSRMQASAMAQFNDYLKSIPGIRLLTYGEPYAPTDASIKEALMGAVLSDNDHYGSALGSLNARKAICRHENIKLSGSYEAENVIVTNGSTEALFLMFQTLLNPNDEVLLIAPFYPEYTALIEYCQCKAVIVKADAAFQPDPKSIAKKITGRTKLLVLNYPNNPTGALLTKDVTDGLYRLVKKYSFYILLDHTYDEILYQKGSGLYEYPDLRQRIVIVNSLSKSHRMTGWRLGYALAEKEIISQAAKLKSMLNVCCPPFLSESMIYALNTPVETDEYRNNIRYTLLFLRKCKAEVEEPQGGFYLFFRIRNLTEDSVAFCKKLAEVYYVGLMPGAFFGYESYIRLSCAVSYRDLKRALKQLKKAIHRER